MLDHHQHSGLELALAHNLSFQEVSVALCGAKNKEQLLSLFKALDNLPKKDILDECLALAKPAQK